MISFIKQNAKAIAMHRATNLMLFFMIIFFLLAYVYFAHAAIRAVTLLEETRSSIRSLSVEVSEMEAKRFLAEKDLSLNNAKSLGFVEVVSQTFIVKKVPKTAKVDF